MAIIYSYPSVASLQTTDLFIISRVPTDPDEISNFSVTTDTLATFVTARVNLTFQGDTNPIGDGTVNLDTQKFIISGTTSEVETTASNNILQIGLPDNVTITNNLTVGGAGNFTGQVTIPLTPIADTDAASKGYVDTAVTGLLDFKGTFRADTGEILSGVSAGAYLYNCPGGGGTRVATEVGDYYIVGLNSGQFYCSFGDLLNIGDSIYCLVARPADSSTPSDWGIVEGDNIEGSGTANKLPIWTDSQVLADSLITQTKVDGGTIFDLNAITTGPYTPAINTKLLDLNSGGTQKFSVTQDGGGGVVLPSGGGVTNPGPSFNMGSGAFSNGKSGVAMGTTTTAFGNGSLAANFLTLASGGGASAFGLLTEASALASAAFGNKSKATGNYSIASGQDTIASGQSAVAIGEKGGANGKNSFVQGFGGTAAGNNSAKFGYDGSAGGNNAVKFGFESIASGNASFASGWQTTASGTYSFTAGDGNTASGERTAAFGVDNNVSGKGSFAIGARNTAASENSFVGGVNNTLTGASGGVPGSQTSFVFGSNNSLDGSESFVAGQSNQATGSTSLNPQNYLILIGRQNQASFSTESIAIGKSNQNNSSPYSTVIGRDNLSILGSYNYIFGGVNEIGFAASSTIIGHANDISGGTNTPNITLLGVGLKYNSNTNAGYGRATYVGYYNDELDPFAQFQIGNGTTSVRKNALSINKESQIKISEYGSGNFPGTAAYNLAVDLNGKIIETTDTTPTYSSFVCLLSQSAAANPQPNIVLENSLGIVSPFTAFTRVSSGEYNLNAPGKFKLLKTIVFLNGGSAENNHDVAWEVIDADNLRIRTHNSDGKLTKASLEIRTYN